MKNPLTNYFCFSSHNTYLTGNQFTSDSKAERYRDDLENGYRCLEIDVHVNLLSFRMEILSPLLSTAIP